VTADTGPVPSLRDWAFAAYDRPGVQEACLELQDRHGMDVVALLWCIWAGEHHGVVDSEVMGPIVAETAAWQAEVVTPLRAVRRRLKHAVADASTATAEGEVTAAALTSETRERLRRQVADAELAAEVIQLDRLDAATMVASVTMASGVSAVAGPPGGTAVRANLARLVSVDGHEPDPDRTATVEALLASIAVAGS
jgi:uncharacterized protein (TIGR02444 family)